MITLHLIGIGTGNPDHVTRQAQKVINSCDLILIPLKGDDKADLAGLRHAICKSCLTNSATRVETFELPMRDPKNPNYVSRVHDWHDEIAGIWEDAIRRHLSDGGGTNIGLLVWGDPSLYDSTLRIAERVGRALPLRVQVTPGITAIQALCASHGITLNEVGASVTITTGRRLREEGWPPGAETLVVMLDSGGAFQSLPHDGFFIWWGAYVGMAEEILISGPLGEVSGMILDARTKAREDHGWIMDIYLLRKR